MSEIEEALRTLEDHARRGNLQQFQNAVDAELTQFPPGYTTEVEGENTLVIVRTTEKGGFLGIGAERIEEPVLKIVMKDKDVQILPEPRDDSFVLRLADALEHD